VKPVTLERYLKNKLLSFTAVIAVVSLLIITYAELSIYIDNIGFIKKTLISEKQQLIISETKNSEIIALDKINDMYNAEKSKLQNKLITHIVVSIILIAFLTIVISKYIRHIVNSVKHSIQHVWQNLLLNDHEEYNRETNQIIYHEFVDIATETKEILRKQTTIVSEKENVRRMLLATMNSMDSYLLTTDRDGNILYYNKQLQEFFPDLSDLTGKNVKNLMPYFQKQLNNLHLIIRQSAGESFHNIRVELNKEMRIFDINISPLSPPSVGAVITLKDVTEKEKMNELLAVSEKMSSLGRLTAGMAHEINNPLGIIVQSAQGIKRRLSDTLEANVDAAESCGTSLEVINKYLHERKINDYVDGIYDAGVRAAGLVQKMLDFSKVNVSGVETFSARTLCENAISLAKSDYESKKILKITPIEFITEYVDDMPDIFVSVSEMEFVLSNLIINSIQALRDVEEGRQRRVVLRTYAKENQIYIDVEDNGPGIPEGHLFKIFEPFFTTKELGQGTGLGLSVAYFIVTRKHNGLLEVSSTLGEGTKFTIILPIREQR